MFEISENSKNENDDDLASKGRLVENLGNLTRPRGSSASFSDTGESWLARDPDRFYGGNAGWNIITWSIDLNTCGGNTACPFEVSDGIILQIVDDAYNNNSLDYDEEPNSWTFTLIATDGGGLSDSKEVTVKLTNVNEPPVWIDGALVANVKENVNDNEELFNMNDLISDPDAADAGNITFALVAGQDAGGLFSLIDDSLLVASTSLDYETKQEYIIQVQASSTPPPPTPLSSRPSKLDNSRSAVLFQ